MFVAFCVTAAFAVSFHVCIDVHASGAVGTFMLAIVLDVCNHVIKMVPIAVVVVVISVKGHQGRELWSANKWIPV